MKLAIVGLLLLGSVTVFGGAEEHFQSQTCYRLQINVDPSIPTELCVETVTVSVSKKMISVYSFFTQNAQMYEKLQLTSLMKQNSGLTAYKATGVIRDVNQNGKNEKLVLEISGLVDSSDYSNEKDLKIKIKQLRSKLSDHSQVHVRTYTYVRE